MASKKIACRKTKKRTYSGDSLAMRFDELDKMMGEMEKRMVSFKKIKFTKIPA